MADVNANIGVHIDTSAALAELKALQRQLANFHSSVSKSSAAAAMAQKGLQTNLLNSINATGKFRAQMGLVRTSTESFTHALEKNKLSMREYFRYAGGSTRTFGKLFKQEFNTIGKVAEERVKKMQTQYIKMGRDASGAMKAISITPNTLNMKDYSTKLAVAAQKQAILNQLLKQGSTNLLNFGKNTQWAGRQLMVGFTVPLLYLGGAAAKVFMDLEKQAVRFKRVYGDMFTTSDETNKALENIQKLAEEFTKYGVAVVDTMEMAANAAAMGKTGADLTAQVAQATRLAVLGGVEQAQALETTISVTNAFGVAAEELAGKINFLNAVENQTVVSIEDLTIAIPKAGPVVKQLGGSVEDLAFFLTAMKEGGINASEGANALKSGLASLINPTKKASDMLAGFGVNIKSIVETNKGNIRQTVIDFSRALDTIDPLNRARAIEQLFGKFQFSRLSTLFQNVTKDGTQAARVLDLAGASVEELAILSERELGVLEDAIGTDFKESVEKLKLALAPIGKEFLKAITPVAKAIGLFLEKFNNLGDGTKKFIIVATTLVGVIGPVLLMTFGLLANGVANIIKLFITMRSGFLRAGANSSVLAQQTQYLNSEQLEAVTVATSLGQAHARLTQSFATETTAVRLLRQAYIDATIAATNFARANPGMMMPGFKGGKGPKKFARGTTGLPGPKGAGDVVPVLGAPGEAIIPAKTSQDPRFKPIIEALVNGTLQGFEVGTTDLQPANNITEAKRKAIKDRFKKLYNKDPQAKQSYRQNSENFNKLINRLTYDPNTKTYSLTTNKGKVFTNIPESKIFEKANYVFGKTPSQQNQFINNSKFGRPSSLEKQLTRASKEGMTSTGAPGSVRRLRDAYNQKSAGIGLDRENIKLVEQLRKQGLTPTEINNFMGKKSESHIFKPLDPKTKWQSGLTIYDHEGIGQYLNRAGKTSVGNLINNSKLLKELGYTDKDILKLKESYAFAKQERQPTNAKQFEHLARIADLEVKAHNSGKVKIPNIYQAKGILGVAAVRTPEIWKEISRSIIKLGDKPRFVNKKEQALIDSKVAVQPGQKVLDSKTGRRVPPTTVPLTQADKTAIPSGQKLNHPKGVMVGPGRFVPALRGVAQDGFNETAIQPSKAVSEIEKQFRSEQKSLRRQIKKLEQRKLVALKQETKIIQEKTAITQQQIPLTKEQIKSQKKEARANRSTAIGKVAGPVAGIAGIGAMAGFMTGNNSMGMAMMGISALATIAPMLTNPLGILVGILATASAGFLLYTKMLKNAREEGMNLAKAMSMSASRVKGLSVLSGQISASEIQAKKRQTTLNPLGEPQRKFGQNVLQSEEGKNILSDVERLVKQNFSTQQIGKILGTNLSQAVLQGAISTDQARSIASALGEQIGSYDIPLNVSAKITQLMGPNGENLKDNPLQVALAIKKESMKNVTEAFDIFKAGKKNPLLAGLSIPEETGGLFSLTSFIPFGDVIKQIFNQKKENAKLDAAGVQLGFEVIGQNQQLLDSVNEQYDKKIKLAKTEKEINDLQIKRKSDIDRLNAENSKTLTEIIEISKSLSDDAFNTTVKESLDSRIKDASAVTKALNKVASEKVLKVKDQTLRRTLQIGLASENGLTPQAIISLTSFVASSETASKSIDFFIKANGLAELETLTAIFGKFTGNEFGKDMTPITREFITKYINENSIGLKDDLAALSALGNFKEQYLVTLDVNSNGVEDLQLATKSLGLIKNFPDKIDKKFLATTIDPEGNFTQFAKDFDVLSQGKDKISKYLYVNYQLGLNDPNLIAAAKAAKMTVPEYIAQGYNEALAKPTISTEPKDSGQRDTTLDELLKRLKLVRDASINARGGIDELRRVMNSAGGDIKIFKGINQQLRAQGINKDLLDFISDLDPAIQKKFITIKNGIVSITADGKKLAKALNEAVLGELEDSYKDQIQGLRAQSAKFTELRAAGLSAAEALEIVTNEQVALAFASGKSKEEIDRIIAGLRELKRNEKRTQDIISPAERIKKEVSMAMEYFDVLEREAKNIYEPQINAVNKLIEANEKLIDIQERKLDFDVDKPIALLNAQSTILNHDLSLIDKAAEAINKKYDAQEKALQDISDIQDDIAAKESSRITIADALTRGDISAAAKAIQERRAEEARKAKERSANALQVAREKQLGVLKNSNGLTRTQIEEKLYTISEQVYALEQEAIPINAEILRLREANYQIEQLQLVPLQNKLKLELDAIQAQKDKWDAVALGVDGARVRGVEYQAVLRGHEDTLIRMKKLWDGITSKELGAASLTTFADPAAETDAEKAARLTKQLNDDTAEIGTQIADLTNIMKDLQKTPISTLSTKKDTVNNQVLSSGLYGPTPALLPKIISSASASGPRGGAYTIIPTPKTAPISYRSRAMGGVIPKVRYEPIPSQIQGYNRGGVIPKYFVAGGYSRGSDTVPAMLTPGEFVVRRNAVESFGVNNLNKINDGSYGGSSVYNYSLNVNVKSDSSPDDIARTVMTQIKRIDNQRIKGQR